MSMNMRELSRNKWDGDNTVEDINAGSLQRIADATEQMAKGYVAMQEEINRLKRSVTWRDQMIDRLTAEIEHLKHSRAGYMAAATKLRNRSAEPGIS